jgi:chemotaxis family two-component system response regulator Rcp1
MSDSFSRDISRDLDRDMSRSPEILMVDDNPADVTLVRESLAETVYQSHLHSACDAKDAIEYLQRMGKYRTTVRPDLVILDLNLAERNGHKVLSLLKSDAELRQIPVIAFSSSRSPQDIARSYEAGANCYVNKPADLKRYFSAARAIEEFWFGYAVLPPRESNDRSSHAHSAD